MYSRTICQFLETLILTGQNGNTARSVTRHTLFCPVQVLYYQKTVKILRIMTKRKTFRAKIRKNFETSAADLKTNSVIITNYMPRIL